MFELLTQPEIKPRIEKIKHTIMPETKWSGEKKKSETLEIYDPGTKERKGYQPIFKTK